MGKSTHKSKSHELKHSDLDEHACLSNLRQDADLWYRLHILLYDLCNLSIDPSSERRICSTTNELYISEPYFTTAEACRIRAATVGGLSDESNDAVDAVTYVETVIKKPTNTNEVKADRVPAHTEDATVEVAIHSRLGNFFEKRKASGDVRPCGPHDMLPIYLDVFDIRKDELKEDKFLSRLRTSGLGDFRSTGNGGLEKTATRRGKGKPTEKKM